MNPWETMQALGLPALLAASPEPNEPVWRWVRDLFRSSGPTPVGDDQEHVLTCVRSVVEAHLDTESGEPSWSYLAERYAPASWDEPLAVAMAQLADAAGCAGVRARILEALWVASVGVVNRGDLGARLIAAHHAQARGAGATTDPPLEAWAHYSRARIHGVRRNDAEAIAGIDEDLADRALTLLRQEQFHGVHALNALLGATTGRRGALRIPDSRITELLEAALNFADTAEAELQALHAIDAAQTLEQHLSESTGCNFGELRVKRLLRAADELEDRGESAIAVGDRLRRALAIVQSAGLGGERLHELNERLRAVNERGQDEMGRVQLSAPIDDDQVQAIEQFCEAALTLGRENIAAAYLNTAMELTLRLSTFTQEREQRGPSLMDVIPGVAQVGDRADGAMTPERRDMNMYRMAYEGLHLRLLNATVGRMVEEHGPDSLISTITNCFASQDRSPIAIEDGVRAFHEERYAAAAYCLLPQLEAMLRRLVTAAGGRRTAWRPDGRQMETTMVPLVTQLAAVVQEPGTTDLVSVLISSPNGLNLRNNALHGILDPGAIGRGEALIVIHGLLLVAGLAPEDGPPESEE